MTAPALRVCDSPARAAAGVTDGRGTRRPLGHQPGERAHAMFLCPLAQPGPAGHVRVTVLVCATQPPHHLVAAVLLGPSGDLRGLTHRELQVLGLLVEGWTNAQIGAARSNRCPTTFRMRLPLRIKGPDHDASADQPASAP